MIWLTTNKIQINNKNKKPQQKPTNKTKNKVLNTQTNIKTQFKTLIIQAIFKKTTTNLKPAESIEQWRSGCNK